jgi:spermidine synthase
MPSPFETLARIQLPDGLMEVSHRNSDNLYRLTMGGRTLMQSDAHASEEALATLGLAEVAAPSPRVLIGGLGMGFTLRAALDALPKGGAVTIAELVPELVDLCRGPLAPLSRDALSDPRVRVSVGDVTNLLRGTKTRFDAVLLDVDNGPRWEVSKRNQMLYGDNGVRLIKGALAPGGVLAVWSADTAADRYLHILRRAGFDARGEKVRARGQHGGAQHAIVIGKLPQLRVAR